KDKMVTFNLGPAKVYLGEIPKTETKNNEIYLAPLDDQKLKYTIFYKDAKRPKNSGTIKIGEVVTTGWMGLELRLLDYLPRAQDEYEVLTAERPTPMTTSAIKIKHKGVEKWLALNDIVKLFGNQSAYLMSYQNRRIDLGFDLKLNKFEVQRYQGTMRAMEYASQVEAVNNSNALSIQQTISMNEPLKFMGYTIYQASFQEDEQTGKPVASVFSINQDPGRPIKYAGSLIFSLGIVWLFYQRRKRKTSE
ncbi:MAG: cytochrome c biogenesis protein ResB, partial [Pseudobdellovibrio sp.]